MSLIRFDLGQNWEIKIFGWMDPGHHSWYPATLLLNVRVDKLLLSEPLLLLALFYQRAPSCLKVGGGWPI